MNDTNNRTLPHDPLHHEPPDDSPSATEARRLTGALEEYRAMLEAGQKPDRREFLRRYPEIAEALSECLSGLEFVHNIAGNLSQSAGADRGVSPDAVEGLQLEQPLGDFRIIREVGKGGMGIVYEAEQLSLRRRVALKVLPFAATMDSRHLQRFHNEAQAAACLHHTNIVPVYFVGCERGVHFYAMQFIDGHPLSDVIHQMRGREKKKVNATAGEQTAAYHSPGDALPSSTAVGLANDSTPLTSEGRRGRDYFRMVAELGMQAAEALDHAHQLGIVHRDIKPGNLLLDARGNLWVTDFGLAQIQTDTRLTMTGDLIGTLRYMSPEQALAKRVVIDHRTDIYSLGATLYELLTLQPAFAGEDRQELLRQIAFEEPATPRRLHKAIPAELETIVLKAMEKNPAERYATAKEVADDLRHWLDDRPIRARRPSLYQQLRKWSRRHRAAVAAGTLCLFVTLLAVAVSIGWSVLDRTARQATAEGEAGALLKEARRLQQEERWPEAINAVRHAQGLLAGGRADPGLLRQAQQLEKDLSMVARLQDIRHEASNLTNNPPREDQAYGNAFADYGLDVTRLDAASAAEFIRASAIRNHLLEALDDWAYIRQFYAVGDANSLLAVARLADDDLWRQRLRDPHVHRDRMALVRLAQEQAALDQPPTILRWLARLLFIKGAWTESIHLLRAAQRARPADFYTNQSLANFQFDDPAWRVDLLAFARVAVAIRPQDPSSHEVLGIHLRARGDLDEAITEFREALRLADRAGFPLAGFRFTLGRALTENGQLEEAIVEFKEALRLDKNYVEAQKHLHEAEQLVRLYHRLSSVQQGKVQPKDATERLALAHLCQRPFRKLYATAANFYSTAFAEKPQLAEDLLLQYRYDAACAAALAGCGQGKDAGKLDAKERSRLRQQALDWLRDNLKAHCLAMEKEAEKAAPEIAKRMQHWLEDDDFAGMRGAVSLSDLPEAERKDWHKLWEKVVTLRKRAAINPKTASSARP